MTDGKERVPRRAKASHVDIVLYEIDMFEHCFHRLQAGKWAEKKDYYLCIEGFLLHYRNLIEFFGSHHGLRANTPEGWSPRGLTDAELASIQNRDLLRDYHSSISRYLGHCDGIRADKDRDWKYVEMYGRIEPHLLSFRQLFPSEPTGGKGTLVLGARSASTETTSSYSVVFDPARIPIGVPKKSDR